MWWVLGGAEAPKALWGELGDVQGKVWAEDAEHGTGLGQKRVGEASPSWGQQVQGLPNRALGSGCGAASGGGRMRAWMPLALWVVLLSGCCWERTWRRGLDRESARPSEGARGVELLPIPRHHRPSWRADDMPLVRPDPAVDFKAKMITPCAGIDFKIRMLRALEGEGRAFGGVGTVSETFDAALRGALSGPDTGVTCQDERQGL